MEIAGRTFLVTGGGSGLGEATAALVAELGGNVLVCDLNEAAGEQAAGALGGRSRFVRTDVTSEEDVETAVRLAVDVFGQLDVVVNCAGIGDPARVLGRDGPMSLTFFRRMVEVNLVGTFNVTRIAAGTMARNEPGDDGERGVVVNTASIAAFEGQIGQAAYSASKGGVVAMTLPIARELARFGIRVNTIAPGIFETPMMGVLPDEARQALAEGVPFPARLGQPSEFASLVRTLVENRMLNGTVIRVDAALRLPPR